MTVRLPSPRTHRALQTLGANLKVARLKRRISVKEFAERVGVSERTVVRLEKGNAGVSIGTLAMAAMVVGELDRISNFLDAGSDDIGLLMEQERLPKRIDRSRNARASSTAADIDPEQSDDSDDEGVGF